MRTALVALLLALGVAGCSGDGPVADEANNVSAVPTDVDVLPPDESVATPSNELEAGDDEDANAGALSNSTP